MNTSNVVSLPAAADLTGKEYYAVKLTSTGVNLAGTSDVPIGTMIRAMPHQEDGVYVGKAVAVQLKRASIAFAVLGATSAAIAVGDGLILDANAENAGKWTPSESSPLCRAVQALTGSDGSVLQVLFL